MKNIDITVERTSQGLRLSSIVNGHYVSKLYIDYSQKEAKERFKEYIKKNY